MVYRLHLISCALRKRNDAFCEFSVARCAIEFATNSYWFRSLPDSVQCNENDKLDMGADTLQYVTAVKRGVGVQDVFCATAANLPAAQKCELILCLHRAD